MSDGAQIEAGRQAWQRLKAQQRTAWADWRVVGEALKIGRDAALAASGAKTPHGKIYTRIFGTWLRANSLDDIQSAHRYRVIMCIENVVEIEAWRAGLDEKQRNRYNHPDAVWFAWRRDMHGGAPRAYTRPYRPPNGHTGDKAHSAGYHRPLYINQDMIKRAAMAMREHWSNDTFKLAAIALAAALRNQSDLLELLPPEPPAKPAPRQIAAPVALELTA